jgi:hypothetical protein
MTDPKTFTGPEGFFFTIHDPGPRAYVSIATPLDRPVDDESFIHVPLTELAAFLTQPEMAAVWEAVLPAKPVDFSQGTFTTAAMWSPDDRRMGLAPTPRALAEAERLGRAEARRQAYVGSTAHTFVDTEGREFPPGTRVVAVGPATVALEPPSTGCAHRARDVGELRHVTEVAIGGKPLTPMAVTRAEREARAPMAEPSVFRLEPSTCPRCELPAHEHPSECPASDGD